MTAFSQISDVFDALWETRPREVKIKKQIARDLFLDGALSNDPVQPTDACVYLYAQHNARRWWGQMGVATGMVFENKKPLRAGRWSV